MTRVRQAGERIEELLSRLRSADGDAAAAAEELVRLLLGLYGDGLGHIMDALAAEGAAGDRVSDRLLADPLVESLLLLHDLHPLDVDTRIQRALDRVRPYLGSHAGGVEYLGTGADGVARLRLEGSCHGCPSSTVTVQLAIQGAIEDAAPEVTEVVVEGMTEPPGPPLLQIGRRPDDAASGLPSPPAGEDTGLPGAPGAPGSPGPTAPPGSPSPGAGRGTTFGMAGDPGWVSLPGIGPPDGRPVATVAGGVPIVVCSVRGTLYAYYDACAACGSSLAGGTLAGERLGCPGCGAGYDVRSAGKSLDDPRRHLDPLPLLTDSQGVRVALPAGAGPGREPAGKAASR
jgi:Fe-S cluster biogenesis protein NfuA/nitrite reductase/ring-hydroxylating ferredoxin subunit